MISRDVRLLSFCSEFVLNPHLSSYLRHVSDRQETAPFAQEKCVFLKLRFSHSWNAPASQKQRIPSPPSSKLGLPEFQVRNSTEVIVELASLKNSLWRRYHDITGHSFCIALMLSALLDPSLRSQFLQSGLAVPATWVASGDFSGFGPNHFARRGRSESSHWSRYPDCWSRSSCLTRTMICEKYVSTP